MKENLLDVVVCARCGHAPLSLNSFEVDERRPGEILTGLLRCRACEKAYPVIGGIPRMLPDSFDEYHDQLTRFDPGLEKEPADLEVKKFRRTYRATQERFGFEWLRYEVTDPDENLDVFKLRTGFAPSDVQGKLVLDAGCGMGRYLQIAAQWGAEVVGLDLSRSVERARREAAGLASVHFIQGDLTRPPLRLASFDFIYSIGVLHHTPNTRNAFQSLCELLRREGRIAIWVYRTFQPEISVGPHKRAFALLQEVVSGGTRLFTTRMPHQLLHYLCYAAVPLGACKRMVLQNNILKHLLFPVVLLPVSTHPKWQVRLCDTFDWLAPRHQWKHTTAEICEWFEEEGLTSIAILDTTNVAGKRPAEQPKPLCSTIASRHTRARIPRSASAGRRLA